MKINTYAVNCNDAWLNTEGDDISGSYVKYKDHQAVVAELEAKCSALAEENMALKEWSPNPHSTSMWEAIEKAEALMDDGMPELAMVEAFEILKMKRTPATDAFLAEVRAQGVDAAIEHLSNKFEGTGHIGVPVMALEWLASQLRQDANTRELVAAGILIRINGEG